MFSLVMSHRALRCPLHAGSPVSCFFLFFVLQSCFSRVWLFATLRTVARQAPLSMGFFRKEYWSGLPRPSPGSLPHSGIEPKSLTSPNGFFTTSAIWEALEHHMLIDWNLAHWKFWVLFLENRSLVRANTNWAFHVCHTLCYLLFTIVLFNPHH